MTAQEPPPDSSPDAVAQDSADRLAVALEDVGFDVGVAFPALSGGVGRARTPFVDLGRVTETVARQLSEVLVQAAERGISVSS